jgi:hypothetical protein
MTQAISSAFQYVYEHSLTRSILKSSKGEWVPVPGYDSVVQRTRVESSLIQFRSGSEESGFLGRCGRSLVVEPVFVVLSLCALVETIARVVLRLGAFIASYFSRAASEEDLEEESQATPDVVLAVTASQSWNAFVVSTDWIIRNIFAEKLEYKKDLEAALEVVGCLQLCSR